MSHFSTLSDALRPFVERGELAGAVALVADAHDILALEAVGWADVDGRVPMSPDAVFWIASQTKPMTASALMMLVDEGRVGLDEPIATYLPEFAEQLVVVRRDTDEVVLRRPPQPVRVAHVLSHTAGFPFLTPLEQPHIDSLSLRDAARLYALMPLECEPGTRYLYSNVGINIAGRIIEVVSDQGFAAFLQERLFDPLHMTDTTFWPSADLGARLVKAYRPAASGEGLQETPIEFFSYPLDDRHRHATPGGGLFSTARDVARFCQWILRQGQWSGTSLLSPQSVAQMTSRQTPAGLDSYGLGWGVGDESFGHGGAYATDMTIEPERGLIRVLLVQHAGFPGNGGACHDAFRDAVRELFPAK